MFNITKFNVSDAEMQVVKDRMLSLESKLQPLVAKAMETVVTAVDDKIGMAMARANRLQLREVRLSIEEIRKELKEESLRKGQFIDAVARYLREIIEPAEKHSEDQELFGERKIVESRMQRIAAEGFVLPSEYWPKNVMNKLADLDDAEFESALSTALAFRQAKIEEDLRRQHELEQLRKDKEQSDKEAAEARKAAQDAQDALRAQRDKDAADEKARKAQERRERNAPDKDKLLRLVQVLRDAEFVPSVRGAEAQQLIAHLTEALSDHADVIQAFAEDL